MIFLLNQCHSEAEKSDKALENLIAKMYMRLFFISNFYWWCAHRSENNLFELEKASQIMDVVLTTEQAKNPLHIFFKTFAWILNQLLRFLKSLWVTFGRTLGEHVTMVASANMFYIAIG